jgi:hypothetical protein
MSTRYRELICLMVIWHRHDKPLLCEIKSIGNSSPGFYRLNVSKDIQPVFFDQEFAKKMGKI